MVILVNKDMAPKTIKDMGSNRRSKELTASKVVSTTAMELLRRLDGGREVPSNTCFSNRLYIRFLDVLM